MLTLIPPALLLLTALSLLALPRLRPGFSSQWLLAVSGAFLTWVSLVILWNGLPVSISWGTWLPQEFFAISPGLLGDEISWPLAFALSTLALSAILVDVDRLAKSAWSDWAHFLGLAALSIIVVFSKNFLSLALTWSMLDLLVLMIRWSRSTNKYLRAAFVQFGFNLGAIMLLLAVVAMNGAGQNADFSISGSSPQAAFILFVAVGLRIGRQVSVVADSENGSLAGKKEGLLQIMTATAAIIPVVRLASSDSLITSTVYLLPITLLIATAAGVRWITANDEFEGLPYWLAAMTALVLTAALKVDAYAANAWVLAMVYAGGFIILGPRIVRFYNPLMLVAMFGFSMLPFSPTNVGVAVYAAELNILAVGFLIVNGFLLYGYLRHAWISKRENVSLDRWVGIIMFAGAAILPLVHIILSQGLGTLRAALQQQEFIWPAAAAISAAALLLLLSRRGVNVPPFLVQLMASIFSFRWFVRLLRLGSRSLGYLINLITSMLEGEGGVLWAFLLVALLVSLFFQLQPGG